jgi:hypothetical protein
MYGLLLIGAVLGYNSILNSMSLSRGIPSRSSGKTSRNSHTTGIPSILFATVWCTDALRRTTNGRCKVTLSKTGEYRQTNCLVISRIALCSLIQLIPRMTSIPCPSKTMRWLGNTCPANSSKTSLAIWLATTQPLGVLIMYDGLVTVSVNFALLAHVELTKSCDAPESNRMMTGCSNSKYLQVFLLPQEYLRPWYGWHTRFLMLGPWFGLSAKLPLMLELLVLCPLEFRTLPSKVPDTPVIESRALTTAVFGGACGDTGWGD